jgi:hypothetical protein
VIASAAVAAPAAIILGAVIVWLALAAMAATYGYSHGYPFWPLFLAGVFLSWALVLLAVAIGKGPAYRHPDRT